MMMMMMMNDIEMNLAFCFTEQFIDQFLPKKYRDGVCLNRIHLLLLKKNSAFLSLLSSSAMKKPKPWAEEALQPSILLPHPLLPLPPCDHLCVRLVSNGNLTH